MALSLDNIWYIHTKMNMVSRNEINALFELLKHKTVVTSFKGSMYKSYS